MGDAIGLFCDGFAGELFNREGEGFAECDVTIIDLATVAREDYSAELSLAVIASLNAIQTIAERDQHTSRQLLTVIDEAHLLTTSPLIAPALTKWSKMGRKLGSWLWQATQNMGDYPGEAEKMLNQAEFWLALVQPRDEIEQIARFRDLNPAQRQLLLSASKQPGCYTEGVLMSDRLECLFRVVPPSLLLSLAGTEKHEKAARADLMVQHGMTELDAARQIARDIDQARGIV